VKLRPKMSCSGGSKSLGVVVFSMVSFVVSISLIFSPTEASAWMLYARALRHRNDAARGLLQEKDSDESNREDRWVNMVELATAIAKTSKKEGKGGI
jgi:hypothetical protein